MTKSVKKRTRVCGLGRLILQSPDEQAALAYDKATFELHDSRAKLNFHLLIRAEEQLTNVPSEMAQETSTSAGKIEMKSQKKFEVLRGGSCGELNINYH